MLWRSRSQNGKAPTTSKKDGAKIASRQIRPPIQPEGVVLMDAPRNEANVNKGPGTACAAPYQARNASLLTQPEGTTPACSSGSTMWRPPNTRDLARQKGSTVAT